MAEHGRLLVIEHELDAPAGLLGPWAQARGLSLSTIHLGGGDQLPARLPDVAAWWCSARSGPLSTTLSPGWTASCPWCGRPWRTGFRCWVSASAARCWPARWARGCTGCPSLRSAGCGWPASIRAWPAAPGWSGTGTASSCRLVPGSWPPAAPRCRPTRSARTWGCSSTRGYRADHPGLAARHPAAAVPGPGRPAPRGLAGRGGQDRSRRGRAVLRLAGRRVRRAGTRHGGSKRTVKSRQRPRPEFVTNWAGKSPGSAAGARGPT